MQIELDLMTVGTEFPTLGVQSSETSWMEHAQLSQVVKVGEDMPVVKANLKKR